jgi:hypothetical protein
MYKRFSSIVRKSEYPCIQIGDFGFQKTWDRLHVDKYMSPDKLSILMGNHDYIPYVYSSPYSIGDYKTLGDCFMFRGAKTIDIPGRVLNLDLFLDEELNKEQRNALLDLYEVAKPRVVISHDLPTSAIQAIFNPYEPYKSATNQIGEAMLHAHTPEIWICGHHHTSYQKEVNGCLYVIIDELGTYDVDIDI